MPFPYPQIVATYVVFVHKDGVIENYKIDDLPETLGEELDHVQTDYQDLRGIEEGEYNFINPRRMLTEEDNAVLSSLEQRLSANELFVLKKARALLAPLPENSQVISVDDFNDLLTKEQ
jgi:hypothetical protein